MNTTNLIILISSVIMNLFSGYLFFTERALADKDGDIKIPNSGKIYAIVLFSINIMAALLFCYYYNAESFIYVGKRIALLSVMWPLGYIDFKVYKIPNRYILLGLIYRSLILAVELLIGDAAWKGALISEVIAALALVLVAILCFVFVKNAIGFGDIKLFIVMGLCLGLQSIWNAMFIAMIITFVVAVILLLTKKKTKKDFLPFGPMLMVGTYISVMLMEM